MAVRENVFASFFNCNINKMKINIRFIVCTIGMLWGGSAFVSAQSDSITLSLDQALTIALSDNPTIVVADMEIKRVDYSRKESIGGLFPTIDYSGTYSRTIKKQVMYMDIEGMDDGLEVGLDNSWNTGFSLTLPIIAPTLWKSLKLSRNQLEQTLESARASRLSMVSQVKKAYYAILMADDSYAVIRQSHDNAEINAETYRQKYKQGTASEYDVLRAEVAVHNYEPALLQAENALRLAKLNLKVLLGLDAELKIGLTTELADYENDMYVEAMQVDTSLSDNTSLRQLDLQTAYLKQALKTQNTSWAPTLAFVGSYTWSSMSNGPIFDKFRWTPYSYVGLSLSIPIFTGVTRFYKGKQARVAYNEMQFQRTNLERNLRMQLTASMDNINAAVKQVASSKESMRQAEKAYQIMQKRFEVGTATVIELDDANVALASSRLSYYQAIHDYLTAQTDLEQVLGNVDLSRYEKTEKE